MFLSRSKQEAVASGHIEVTEPALIQFADWFRRNYPGPDTLIHKPDWHAPKIFRAAIAAARHASPVPAEPSGWRTMDSAPKDGTIFDVWLGEAEQADVDFYCLSPGSRRSPEWRWFNGKFRPVGGIGGPVFVEPTHWMPLPASPEREGA